MEHGEFVADLSQPFRTQTWRSVSKKPYLNIQVGISMVGSTHSVLRL